MTLGELKTKILIPQDKANHDVFGSWIGDVAAFGVVAYGLLATEYQWQLVLLVAGCAAVVAPALVGLPLMLPWFIV